MTVSAFVLPTLVSTTTSLHSSTFCNNAPLRTTSLLRPRSVRKISHTSKKHASNVKMTAAEIARLKELPLPSQLIQAEYIWIDGFYNLRSKARVVKSEDANAITSLPEWNFDGSSTGQAAGDDSEVILKPVAKYKDPFRAGGILVMCEAFTPGGEPLETNSRFPCKKVMDAAKHTEPMFGLEQE